MQNEKRKMQIMDLGPKEKHHFKREVLGVQIYCIQIPKLKESFKT